MQYIHVKTIYNSIYTHLLYLQLQLYRYSQNTNIYVASIYYKNQRTKLNLQIKWLDIDVVYEFFNPPKRRINKICVFSALANRILTVQYAILNIHLFGSGSCTNAVSACVRIFRSSTSAINITDARTVGLSEEQLSSSQICWLWLLLWCWRSRSTS